MILLRCQAGFADTPESDRPDIGPIHQFVLQNQVFTHLDQFVAAIAQRHAINFGRITETLHMISQPEYLWAVRRLVYTDTFENGRAIVQGMGHHVYCGLFPGDDLAIHPD